ncbi:MAG: SufD family Fe-S cluster assembly protein, partial [Rubricoccaceae bacterium]|nr:SufD family Fe-S cluster assembly protein [Rubricoccaceae bacterium]
MTTDQTPDLLRRLLDEADRAYSGDGAPRPFAARRREARDRFAALGFPTKKDEAWKYTDLRPALRPAYALSHAGAADRLARADLDAYRIPGLDAWRVVLVNGAFAPSLSDLDGLGATAQSLWDAASDEVVARYLGRTADDAFPALNTAFDLDGLFLHVPDGVALEKPLHVINLVDADADAFVQSRHLLVFGRNAQARVVETHHVRGDAETFGNHVTEIVVAQDAVVDHYRVQDEGPRAHQVNTTHAVQEGRSVFSTATFTFDGGIVRNDLTVVPDAEGCETNLYGLYVLRGGQHVDNHTFVDHAKPGCTSNELYKGIVYDRSTGVFNGKVFVRRDAQQTNAYQQSQGVVLSDDAHHYSKPELEIYADDVKCSHGSTTGEIDPEALYYCRAR